MKNPQKNRAKTEQKSKKAGQKQGTLKCYFLEGQNHFSAKKHKKFCLIFVNCNMKTTNTIKCPPQAKIFEIAVFIYNGRLNSENPKKQGRKTGQTAKNRAKTGQICKENVF